MKNTVAAVGAAVLAVVVIALVATFSLAAQRNAAEAPSGSLGKKDNQEAKQVDELKIETLEEGTGREAQKGDRVQVHYRGTLLNGEQFDASYDRGEPFTFNLGAGEVIKGWDEGVAGMKEGEKRKLVIPPDMAYGQSGSGSIPPNSPLVFEVELIKVL